MKKTLSAGLFLAGLLLLYFGYQEYNSFSSELNELFTGSPSDRAVWMLIGGSTAAIAGLVGFLRK